MIRSEGRVMLCDRFVGGGGPGGGGGIGIPGSHLDFEDARDRVEDVGVLTALADTARREDGGREPSKGESTSVLCNIAALFCAFRRAASLLLSGGIHDESGLVCLREEELKNTGGLSLEGVEF